MAKVSKDIFVLCFVRIGIAAEKHFELKCFFKRRTGGR